MKPLSNSSIESLSLTEESEKNSQEIPITLEKQIEDFLENNLEALDKRLSLYRDENGKFGRQYPTDVGIIDLLCTRDDEFVVIELKRSKSSDNVIGQISRYMGWVQKHLSEGKPVYGLILSYESDLSLKYAILPHPNISLKYYKLKLELLDEDQL